ncbi:MAG TPA: hypothetical protein VMW63_06715 [Methanoregulaceae archaeon]|nr:hypothetical protein [Methanoregulaceae archaeon]
MAEKLCPFDKNPCIREQCAIFIEKEDCCSLAIQKEIVAKRSGKEVQKERERDHSKFKAHLFD